MTERNLEDELFRIGLAALAAVTALAVLYQCVFQKFFPAVPCFFSTILGIYCPGCGGTRALVALLRGQLLRAVWYHPFIPYFAFIYIGFMLTQGLQRIGVKRIRGWKFHYWYLWVGVGIFAVNFIVKNVLRLKFHVLMLAQFPIR
ncbi:MAG: DUF2752 domain-containing protein [Firmicutes bacterium]|nr:DUF2752 domain-containing protein [Bacillota bacterium]